MRNSAMILAIGLSLVANVYLAGRLVRTAADRSSHSPEASVAPAVETHPAQARTPKTATASAESEASAQFLWSQVESEDLAAYARNLSRAGFPQEAIRDALIPVLEQSYAAVLSEHGRFAFAPRWAEPPETIAERSRRAIDEARESRRNTLKHVFGMDEHEAQGYKPWQFSIRQEDFPSLEQPQRERLNALKAKGLQGDELESAMQPLITRQEAECSAFLSTEEVQRLLTNARP